MQRFSKTRICLLWICVWCVLHLSAQEKSANPPMRTGNGSDLELNNLSWPRENQLPTVVLDNRFMQKRLSDYLAPVSQQLMKPTTLFPENPSEFMLRVILLHTVKDSIAGLYDELIALMTKELLPDNLLKSPTWSTSMTRTNWGMGASGPMSATGGVAFVGLIDPVEIYRNWQRRKREMRTQMVLLALFGDNSRLLTKSETDSLRQEENRLKSLSVTPIAHPISVSTLLQNDTVVAPSKPKFTAPLFGKERPVFLVDSLNPHFNK